VKPSLAAGLVVFVAYVVILTSVSQAFAHDIDFTDFTVSAENFRKGVVYPIGIISILLVIVTTFLGWWRPVLAEPRTTPRWLMIVPGFGIAGLTISVIADADLWPDKGFLVTLLVGFALVGFSEELMTRGILLTAIRARHREVWAWLISTVCFGLMHGVNILGGQDVGTTLRQVGFVLLPGTLLYICRRASGSLIPAMIVHALFDSSLTIHGGPGSELNNSSSESPIFASLFIIVGVVCTVVALIRKRLHHDNPDAYLAPLLGQPSPA
jgi:membrane protease YdiL (CAAX protease family)